MCIDIYEWMVDNIFIPKGVDLLAVTRHNITLEEGVYDEFCKYAGKKGIKVSTWINIQMKQFIEEEKDVRRNAKEALMKMGASFAFPITTHYVLIYISV